MATKKRKTGFAKNPAFRKAFAGERNGSEVTPKRPSKKSLAAAREFDRPLDAIRETYDRAKDRRTQLKALALLAFAKATWRRTS